MHTNTTWGKSEQRHEVITCRGIGLGCLMADTCQNVQPPVNHQSRESTAVEFQLPWLLPPVWPPFQTRMSKIPEFKFYGATGLYTATLDSGQIGCKKIFKNFHPFRVGIDLNKVQEVQINVFWCFLDPPATDWVKIQSKVSSIFGKYLPYLEMWPISA